MAHLTKDDVTQLLDEPSLEVRAETAAKVAAVFNSDRLDPAARTVAEEIFRLMVRDVEVRVRQALSESLKDSEIVPHDVALSLAKDVIEVAEPILTTSQVLTDADLIDIVRTRPTESRVAVAKRADVSPEVSDALVETRDEEAVATLVENPGARVAEKTFTNILDIFPDSDKIKHNMVHRPVLPVRTAERLVTMVSDRLRDRLITHHEMSPDVAADLILDSREKATLGLLTSATDRGDVDELVRQLHANGRLTPSIILRALCTGDLLFFESAMARRAGVPVSNAHLLIYDRGQLGLKEIYRKAGLPRKMFPAIKAAVAIAFEMDYDGGPRDRERFRSRMIERFLTRFDAEFNDLDPDNIEYLLTKIGHSLCPHDAVSGSGVSQRAN